MCSAARVGVLAVGLIGCSSMTLAVGPEWGDDLENDAGSLPETSQKAEGTGELTKINGFLGGDLLTGFDAEDMYLINIVDPDAFVATTTSNPQNPGNPGSAEFNTTLWLFEAGGDFDGRGLLANKSAFIPPPLGRPIFLGEAGDSRLGPTATDETRVSIKARPGLYYIAISFNGRFCTVGDDFIFDFNDGAGEISGWDGPADNDASVSGWESEITLARRPGGPLYYSIAFNGAELVPPNTLSLALDIRPGVCPNNFNVYWVPGVLKASILGSASFDVSSIDPVSIRISRADGVGGQVAANADSFDIDDNGTPFSGGPCECHDLNGDGFDDLLMQFDKDAMIDALEFAGMPCGAEIPLIVSGQLTDGTSFTSHDCIVLID